MWIRIQTPGWGAIWLIMSSLMSPWRGGTEWQNSSHCALKTSSDHSSKACQDRQLWGPFRVCHSRRGVIDRDRKPSVSQTSPAPACLTLHKHCCKPDQRPHSPHRGSENIVVPGREPAPGVTIYIHLAGRCSGVTWQHWKDVGSAFLAQVWGERLCHCSVPSSFSPSFLELTQS